jgi:hypothetical protein
MPAVTRYTYPSHKHRERRERDRKRAKKMRLRHRESEYQTGLEWVEFKKNFFVFANTKKSSL